MRQTELDRYKRNLLTIRARLRGDVTSILDDAFSDGRKDGAPADVADAGSEVCDQELALSLTQCDGETLNLIDAALKRIADGTFGVCVGSGQKIPKARLDAIPWTPYCIEYASQLESSR